MIYHISWLESAIEELRKSDKIDVVNGDLTIEEFIREFMSEELDSAIKL